MGSLLSFWKWPQQYQPLSREGQPHYEMNNFPQFLITQNPAKTKEYRTKMKNKVDNVRKNLYIDPGTVLILTHMFYVRKYLNDIWTFYNGTSCGFNPALWAPYFGLPIVQHTLSALFPGYSQCDMDVGKLNHTHKE